LDSLSLVLRISNLLETSCLNLIVDGLEGLLGPLVVRDIEHNDRGAGKLGPVWLKAAPVGRQGLLLRTRLTGSRQPGQWPAQVLCIVYLLVALKYDIRVWSGTFAPDHAQYNRSV
jgi:hypothetical protein